MEERSNNSQLVPLAPPIPECRQIKNGNDDYLTVMQTKIDNSSLSKQRMRQKALQFALVAAIEKHDDDLVQELIAEGVNVDAEIIFTKTPLTHSIELQHEKIALILLKNGCNPNLNVDEFPYPSPIHFAARENLSNVIEKIIELKADVNMRNQDGMTPLHIASYFNKAEALKALLKFGANIDLADSCGRTPLHRSVETGSIDIVKILIENHANVNAKDIKCWTALHLAIALDFQNIIKLLLENKCRLDIEDVNGRAPLAIACDFLNESNVEIVRTTQFNFYLRRADFLQGRYVTILQRAREHKEMLPTVMTLINAGADIDGPTLRPITVAMTAGNVDTVCMLISAGARIPQHWEQLMTDGQRGHRMMQMSEWLAAQYNLQYTLQKQSRRKIRKLLAEMYNNVEKAIDMLPLPTAMKIILKF